MNRLCPCCGSVSEVKPLKVTCKNTELADIGSGYVMFFKLITWYAGLMLVFAIIAVVKAIANANGDGCLSTADLPPNSDPYTSASLPVCVKDWVSVHSVANYGIFKTDESELLWMMMVLIVNWVVLSAFHQLVGVTAKQAEKLSDTPSDWTVMVKGLPDDENEDHITRNFEAYGTMGTLPCKVKKVCLAYNSSEYEELEKKVTM